MIHPLLIIGGGPAGLTAAVYGARANAKPIVLMGSAPGGQLMTTTVVENWPGAQDGIDGVQLILNMQAQAKKFGAELVARDVTRVDFSSRPFRVWAGETEYQANAVIVATGARSRMLGLPDEQKFFAKGLHTCATCDGAFYKEKTVAVVGGGDAAAEESSFLSHFAKKIFVYVRGSELRASKVMADRMMGNPKIEIVFNTEVIGYHGDAKLNGITIKDIKDSTESNVAVDALFFAIGHIPNTDLYKEFIDRHEATGYFLPKDNVYTKIEGVFVAGDCADWIYRQAITSSGFGCMAAIAATRWLEKNR